MKRDLNWITVLGLIIGLLLTINGFLVQTALQRAVSQLDELVKQAPAVENRVTNLEKTSERHEAKLGELERTKQDKPGL